MCGCDKKEAFECCNRMDDGVRGRPCLCACHLSAVDAPTCPECRKLRGLRRALAGAACPACGWRPGVPPSVVAEVPVKRGTMPLPGEASGRALAAMIEAQDQEALTYREGPHLCGVNCFAYGCSHGKITAPKAEIERFKDKVRELMNNVGPYSMPQGIAAAMATSPRPCGCKAPCKCATVAAMTCGRKGMLWMDGKWKPCPGCPEWPPAPSDRGHLHDVCEACRRRDSEIDRLKLELATNREIAANVERQAFAETAKVFQLRSEIADLERRNAAQAKELQGLLEELIYLRESKVGRLLVSQRKPPAPWVPSIDDFDLLPDA